MATARELLKNPLTIAALRATIVRDPVRFTAFEVAAPTGRVARHVLRRSGLSFYVRHRTRDMEIVHEVLLRDGYEVPAEVTALLPAAPKVLDLGGNIGLFAVRTLERWPQARVTSWEPDPSNLALLEACRVANAAQERWDVVAAAAMTAEGSVRFAAGAESYSRVREDGGIEVPGHDVLPALAAADLAKVDIEGAEWPILRDPRLKSTGPPAMVLEYHPLPEADAHAEAPRLLREAGYTTRTVFQAPDIAVGHLWAWRA
ncbi:FkbM family methyltransferase [Conexibacter sp. SYSU D00693]|uniref:FkbM family methyltransferase n=1 Tax=Conexibacter sp. SYSU D00693 TaxID=2812560 RepID=UPI00196A3A97|nr:FkbM family methyltransferase [Conexibacter sp. SYSU D00693]